MRVLVGLPAIANIAFGMPPCSSKVNGEGLPGSGRRPRSPKRLDSILRSMCVGPQLCIALTCNALVRDIPCLIERTTRFSCTPLSCPRIRVLLRSFRAARSHPLALRSCDLMRSLCNLRAFSAICAERTPVRH